MLEFKDVLPQLRKISTQKRRAYLADNKHILRQGNIACLLIDNEAAAFPTIFRVEEEIAGEPGNITLQLQDDRTFPIALKKFQEATNIKLVQLDSSTFAYEPFLWTITEYA